MNERLKMILIFVGTGIFIAVVGLSVTKYEAKSQAQVAGPSKVLVAALDANKPSAAPEGAEGYVKGVREAYGRVRSARFLGAYTARHGSGSSATTDTEAEILVRTKRGGAVVLQLDFEEATINGMQEVEPDEVQGDLTKAQKAAVKRDFARRGEPANITVLSGTFTRDEVG